MGFECILESGGLARVGCVGKRRGNFRHCGIAVQKHFVVERYEIHGGFLWAFAGDPETFHSRENFVLAGFRYCRVQLSARRRNTRLHLGQSMQRPGPIIKEPC